jgi:phosphatidylglycerophosphate synthase
VNAPIASLPHPVHAVVIVSNPVAQEMFAGRTLVDRHLEILKRAGVTNVRIVADVEWTRLEQEPADGSGRQLVIRAERVFDARLYARALHQPDPVMLIDHGSPIGLEARERNRTGVPLEIDAIPPYSRELRREIRPYWLRVESVHDRPAVTRLLVEASGKGHQDLPAAFINAPIEKALMQRLANTAITPNHMTVLCNVVAYAVVLLFARGYFLSGAMAAMVVGVLDGLDGRQARVQIRTSELGRVEHLLDKIYEILWIVALGYGLSSGFTVPAFARGVLVWCAAYLVDTAAYDIVKWRKGIQLDEASPTDAFIRLLAGRRNVYICIVLLYALFGRVESAFNLVIWWALVTAATHTLRAALIVSAPAD